MMDALLRLFKDGADCCRFYQTITSTNEPEIATSTSEVSNNQMSSTEDSKGKLNDSQWAAVHSCDGALSLIWGPPGLPPGYFIKAISPEIFFN